VKPNYRDVEKPNAASCQSRVRNSVCPCGVCPAVAAAADDAESRIDAKAIKSVGA